MTRPVTLGDLAREDCAIYLHCPGCGFHMTFAAQSLIQEQGERAHLDRAGRRQACPRCRRRGVTLRPDD